MHTTWATRRSGKPLCSNKTKTQLPSRISGITPMTGVQQVYSKFYRRDRQGRRSGWVALCVRKCFLYQWCGQGDWRQSSLQLTPSWAGVLSCCTAGGIKDGSLWWSHASTTLSPSAPFTTMTLGCFPAGVGILQQPRGAWLFQTADECRDLLILIYDWEQRVRN